MRIAFYLIVIFYLLRYPLDTAHAARNALIIWGENVVPTLFPYMLFCRSLLGSLRGTSLPSHAVAAALGILGGSPSGAAVLMACRCSISRRTLYALCALTGTISPMFLLGTIQSWTNDPNLCTKLLLTHWTGAVACALIVFGLYHHHTERCILSVEDASQTPSPLSQSIDAILQVGGCIIGYSVLAEVLKKALLSFSALPHLAHAALEVSGGIHAICKNEMLSGHKEILLAAACGFTGCSILAQNYAFLKKAGIHMHQLVFFALLRMMISVGMILLIASIPYFSSMA